MKAITDLLSSPWAHALGWTLLHSLWQALAIWLLVKIALRFIPPMRANIRYAAISIALFLFTAASGLTFLNLISTPATTGASTPAIRVMPATFDNFADSDTVVSLMPTATSLIEQNIPLILALWFAGFMVFSLRIASGMFYTYALKSTAVTLENEWDVYVRSAAQRLGIRRLIRLAESAIVSTPMVIGYFKPVILLPVGVLTGLTSAQVEAILLHELAHIRRHDFAVNLVQSVAEAVFFFNPFIWMLSGMMRKEREYCCDDLVVREHGGVRGYAEALARLAENTLGSPVFAMTAVREKHQLLNRIRRIMERSMKSYSGRRGKIIPALLLVSALFCISWLGTRHNQTVYDMQSSAQDTIHPKKQTATLSRQRVVTIDENGQPHEEVVEKFEGDESLRPLLEKGLPLGQPAPPDPVGAFPRPSIPDTIPPIPPAFDLNAKQWSAFSKAFREQFKTAFPDAFVFRGEDATAFLKKFEEQFRLQNPWTDSTFLYQFGPNDFSLDSLVALERINEQLARVKELQLEHFKQLERFKNFEQFHLDDWAVAPRPEKTLREHLIEDGYLGENERIESMQWSDNGVRVNGKSIRKADREKYRKLYDEFMNGNM